MISIIIRTKNEERWISHCLKMVFAQDRKDVEVILVDSGSTDGTVEAAKRFPLAQVVALTEFRPGAAINAGIRKSKGEFLVCLSAHCVPKDEKWLSNLLKNFDEASVAGVYGRQLPVSFSEPSDKRDLLITFGLDRRVQVKDYFFHNANSMFRRSVWEKMPFDEAATNIEDRIWGKAVIEAGYKIVYEPEAAVFHHHGIHQDNNPQRAKSVVSVIERFEGDTINAMPDSWKAGQCNVAAVLPVLGKPREAAGHALLAETIENLKQSKYAKSIYVLSENADVRKLAERSGIFFIQRPSWLESGEKTMEDAVSFALTEIEKTGNYPEAILTVNYLYPFRPKGLFDELIVDLQHKGLDTVFVGYCDYQNVWARDTHGSFSQIGEGFKTREHKNPLYEAHYGLGCATATPVIRSGKIVGGRIGIFPIDDRLYTIKADSKSDTLIAAAYEEIKKRDR